ncbi:ethanolamine utilization protein EutH [Clostridium sp. C8-1-8]|uniref:ethanolamine utilization protein EutH n=1 Tax=Clostridium sp. C8-1-8 TaxID=2698831 RepID=UPI00136F7CF3|nr:ethanolamine utilization protein EutH [Clostridium sp. C8-1-8]
MDVNKIIVSILAVFMVIGAIDKITGNKRGYGRKFDEGFLTMGSLAISMIGIIALAPIMAKLLKPIVVPIYSFLGADPSMFATSLLALDMGGYPLAMELAKTREAGLFSGILLGSMMGATIVFTIPVALGIIEKEDHEVFAKGILSGIVTIPLGCIVGGIAAGFKLAMIFHNLVPIITLSLLLAFGLILIPKKMIKGFVVFAKVIMVLVTVGTVLAILEATAGITLVKGMASIYDGIKTVGSIAIMLAGAFPMVHFLNKLLGKKLKSLGNILKVNETSVIGLISSLANVIPTLGLLKEMDERGKLINIAFAVSAASVFGGQLGFTAGVSSNMIFPMIVGKLTAGICAVILAIAVTKNQKKTRH